ncbi:DNA primase [Enterovirga rhinocerotis]|uniref:DNA primase n=1 Tax=Enterovirga rhinocerotis TaxID=1339210 RepID=A0A4R7BTQ5_9HYPH|nr:DNA primase [Enterovirga rhinocerotis]TDR89134.1 DNA primase [Enterovirga rhinocerotis]
MRYPPHILDEIRARLPVSSVVGRKVRLKKAGREWRGLSPFNAEKTPSFYANDQKGRYFDFSAGKDGDIFNFLMETEGLTFPEAVERLAADAGVPLPKATPEAIAQEVRRRSLHEVMDLAAAFFEANLHRGIGRAARDYLERRAIGEETQAAFRIGYAPADRFALRDHLAAKDVSAEAMAETGLLVTGEDIAVPYDRFRDRIMFPIADSRGQIVGFGGRAMSADVPAKYLNSPETPLFHKGRLLYNHHRARGAAHEAGTVIAVEGYVDVIALAQVGLRHAVAPLGTALTEDQLGLLWRMSDEPILCFDGDAAGQRAAAKAVGLALPHLAPGKSLRFALLPQGQDPDDLARSGGRAALDTVLAGARPLVDMLWAREWDGANAETPERRAAVAARLRDAVATIRDETLRRFYRDEIEARLRQMGRPAGFERGGRRGGGQTWQPPGTSTGYLSRPIGQVGPAIARFADRAGASSAREALIAAALIAHPDILHGEADSIATLDMVDPDARALCNLLVESVLHGEPAEPEIIEARADRAGLRPALDRLRTRVRPGDRWMLEPAADTRRLEEAVRQALVLQRRARTLHSEKRAAERAFADDQSEATLSWLQEVSAELTSLDGTEAEPGRN